MGSFNIRTNTLELLNMSLSLKQICSLYATDKNCLHCYIDEVYEDLFRNIRYDSKKVLEIGVDTGASLCMWAEYFENANIIGVDIKNCETVLSRERIQFMQEDAYCDAFIDSLSNDFDIIIDDGPHTLPTMTTTIEKYSKKLSKNGILVIEDLQDFHWSNILKQHVMDGYSFEVRDLRRVRNRYDDIIIVIKSQ